ncbi:dihydrodipicolinate synthase family protein [Pseudovibrio sp. Tun.PSC04-5.I4]|uniref:dihydrodipicolinate synthase family protein n=1 Tax=Pseudovibrio sp. Tun.PSC04-5.I4 TaxID=1798213 RepID=UPI000891F45D|nr:dihydrodipicolinate synthase family protein [Pseudovibrio sp. Tun.PSC04-5.I4]SDR00594.1 4-hydroxy-tetrahydrodipicolinate synthase [Pseudovibrio sp. Tun.PSC04-5.I4]
MHGIIAAVPTPVDPNGQPQKAMFLEHCRWVLENGCDGLNILGSTGEANSFSATTRKEIMSWTATELDQNKLMVGTGTPSLQETIELTLAADDLGYPVALVLPPYYYKPITNEGLVDWYNRLNAALGDRKIAIYFYNYPQMTGMEIPIEAIETLHKSAPDRFCGIKDSSGNLEYCRAISSAMSGMKVFPSSETSLGEAAHSNFTGCISATTNHTGQLCAKVWANRHNDNSDQLRTIGEIRAQIAGPYLVPSIKYLVSKRMRKTAWEHVHPPFCPLNQETKSKLDELASQLSYLSE